MTPFVDAGRLQTTEEFNGLVTLLQTISDVLDAVGVDLHMETDLDPCIWAEILEKVSHPRIRICFDIGDRASKGYDPEEDFKNIGKWLGSVHIKDRILGGYSVPLGTGSASFPTCFRLIHSAGYQGPYILQTAREEGISEVALARRNQQFVERIHTTI